MPTRKQPAPKSNSAIISQRVNTVLEMLVLGATRAMIIEKVTAPPDKGLGWDVSDRTVDDYIRRAKEGFANDAKVNREEQVGKAIWRLEYIVRKTIASQEFKTSLAAQKQIIDLLGLAAPTKAINLTQDISAMTDEELENEIKRLNE